MTSHSNALYDVESRLEDVRSFLHDIQRLDLAVNTYGNYKVLTAVSCAS